MKKILLLGIIIPLLTMSCSKDDKIKELEAQIDSLKAQNTERNILSSELLEDSSVSQSDNTNQIDIQNAEQIAINFINTYTDTDEFPYNLVTDNFSKLYKKWQSSDFIEYNRIVNGQDYGSNYKLSKILKTEGNSVYLLLTATRDWVGYKITIKATKVNGKWLVDGSGDLNIPKSLVAKN